MNETLPNPTSERSGERTPEPSDSPTAPLIRFSDALVELRADADANYLSRASGQLRGPITGLPRLDREISRAFTPGLHGVYGNAGAGKTAFGMQVATSCGFPALYITCEMAPSELLRRHTARVTQTFLGRLKSGEMSGEQVELLARRALGAAPHVCLLDATRAPASPFRVAECAYIAKGEAAHVLIVVDSLQSWAEMMAPAGAGEYETINAGLLALRRLAHEMRCPILFLSERNREANKKPGGGLNSGAGTRKIEYSAETVLDLDRDMDEQANGAGEFRINLHIVKNRHGNIGVRIPLLFNGALQQFHEAESSERGYR